MRYGYGAHILPERFTADPFQNAPKLFDVQYKPCAAPFVFDLLWRLVRAFRRMRVVLRYISQQSTRGAGATPRIQFMVRHVHDEAAENFERWLLRPLGHMIRETS